MTYRSSPLNKNARRTGKRAKTGDNGGEDLPINPKLDPSKVETFLATCSDCGNLGSYFNQGDATRAEREHQQRAHSNSAHKRTVSDAAQAKRNKHGEGGKK